MDARPGRLVTVMSLKGGVGKSMLACNLACRLALGGHRTAILDLDLQSGDVGVVLNLGRTPDLSDLLANFDSLDAEFVQDVLPEGPGGVRVLPAPATPEYADLVSVGHIRLVLDLLQAQFDVVVVDTAAWLGDIALEAIERSDKLVLVTAPSIAAVKNAQLALQLTEKLQVPSQHVALVLNHCEPEGGLSREAIEAHLRVKVTAELPHAPRVVRKAMDSGKPFVATDPDGAIGRKMTELAGVLVPTAPAGRAEPSREMRLAAEGVVG